MKNYISVGITGGIGSGKTFVCRIIQTMGYPVFYADKEAKAIISTEQFAVQAIKDLFGSKSYLSSGEINRAFLSKQIFSHPELREKMNAIVHPLVRKKFAEWAAASNSPIVFNEAAILFETAAYKNFDKTVLVLAPEALKIQRIKERDNSSIEEIKAKMNVQWSDEKKRPLANFIIENDEVKPLMPQITTMLEGLK